MILDKCALNINSDFRELQPHGTLQFPCAAFFEEYSSSKDDVIPWHWHEDMEVIYVKSGVLKLQTPKKTFYLVEGQSVFINSAVMHFASAEASCKINSLVFSPMLLAGTEESVFYKKYIQPLIQFPCLDAHVFSKLDVGQQATNALISAFEAILDQRSGYEFVVREKLSFVCLSLYCKYKNRIKRNFVEPNQDEIRMRKMQEFICQNYTEKITLSQIAKTSGISNRECLRCFQRTIQMPPMQYLIKYRVMQGADLLHKKSAVSISDIALQCGFESPSNFSYMFKRYFNCTPMEYRKKCEEQRK